LGRGGGRLGLVQIGVKEGIYLLDVLTYGKNLEVLKEVLENEEVEKIFWDGRFASAELWHDHEISIVSAVDIQLVHIQEKTGGRPTRGFLPADTLETAFLGLSEETLAATELDLRAFNRRISHTSGESSDLLICRSRRDSTKTTQRSRFLAPSTNDNLCTRLLLLQNRTTKNVIQNLPRRNLQIPSYPS